MTLKDQLLEVARRYCEARKLSMARVSTLIFNSGAKLALIEDGADLSTARFEAAMAWFSAKWPDGTDWPLGIPRPPVANEASSCHA